MTDNNWGGGGDGKSGCGFKAARFLLAVVAVALLSGCRDESTDGPLVWMAAGGAALIVGGLLLQRWAARRDFDEHVRQAMEVARP